MPDSIASPEVHATFEQSRTPQTRRVALGSTTVEIITPFPSPIDWRDHWIYFLLLDRFNNPQAAPRFAPFDGQHGVFQGGTFEGVREQLAYLRELGVGAIWLSPVLKNCQYNPFTFHGYGIQDFLEIDPRFCSDPKAAATDPRIAEAELQALIDEAHARGMYVIFDIVLNHAGDVFEYVFDNGRHSATASFRDHEYTINWRDENGHRRPDQTEAPQNPHRNAAVWPTELRHNEVFRRKGKGGESGGDFESLKELVTDQKAFNAASGSHFPVRNALIRGYQYLIAKFDVDGFRIDTLKYIEPDFARAFGNSMREFAMSIGKKNFFTFGEVYDNEEQITRFIGRQTSDDSEFVGVDAALDFPLFFSLPMMAKGMTAPSAVVGMFEHRKAVGRNLLSSHGEASRYFVTFLDNHDQRERFYFSSPADPDRFEDQLLLGVSCLFALQGIPCLYYGTEQGLHGSGNSDAAVREALWGKPNAFNRQQSVFEAIEAISSVRASEPAIRYGRQYFRPLSGDGIHFGISPFSPGVLAWSRILNNQEVLIVANAGTVSGFHGEVIVDFSLNHPGSTWKILYSNLAFGNGGPRGQGVPGAVQEKAGGTVEIHEIDGAVSRGPVRTLPVTLAPMEIQILAKIGA